MVAVVAAAAAVIMVVVDLIGAMVVAVVMAEGKTVTVVSSRALSSASLGFTLALKAGATVVAAVFKV